MHRRPLPALALAGATFAGLGPAAARSSAGDGGFVGGEMRELVEICAVQPDTARYLEARTSCHGYLHDSNRPRKDDSYRRGLQDGRRGPR